MVSIVILTLNQLPYTRQCLGSILAQTRGRYELIFVDNGSTDGTVEFLESWGGLYSGSDPREDRRRRGKGQPGEAGLGALPDSSGSGPEQVSVIKNGKNLGFSKGCNQGILASSGEQVLLLNNDTVVTPGWLEKLLLVLSSQARCGLAGPVTNKALPWQEIQGITLSRPLDCPRGQSSQPGDGIPTFCAEAEQRQSLTTDSLPLHLPTRLQPLLDFSEKLARERRGKVSWRPFLSGFCLLFTRDLIDSIGLLDESLPVGGGEDIDFCLRARNAGFEAYVSEEAFIYHYGGATFHGEGIPQEVIQDENMKSCSEKWGLPATMGSGGIYVPEGGEGVLLQDPALLSRWNAPLMSFDLRDPDLLVEYRAGVNTLGGAEKVSWAGTFPQMTLFYSALEKLARGRYRESLEVCRDILALKERSSFPEEPHFVEDPGVWYLLAEGLRLLDEEEALFWYRKCCDAPDSGSLRAVTGFQAFLPLLAKNQMAVFFASHNEWIKGEELLMEALEGAHDGAGSAHSSGTLQRLLGRTLLFNLGYILLQQKKSEEAERIWQEAMREDPFTPGLWSNLVTLLFKRGKKTEAVVLLESLVHNGKATAPLPSHLLPLAKLKIQCGMYQEAILLCGRMIERYPSPDGSGWSTPQLLPGNAEEGELFSIRGMAYLALGRYQEAISDLESSLQRLGPIPGILNNLAVALARIGDSARARKALLKAVEVAPWYEKAKENLAKIGDVAVTKII